MIQEEKAKAYDKALKKAEAFYYSATTEPITEREVLANIFPELAESEGERIRKELINSFSKGAEYDSSTNGIKDRNIIAWLEKQGTSYTKMDVDDAYLKGMSDAKNEIEKQYEANYQIRKDIATFIFNCRGDIKDRAKWMNYLGIKVSLVEKQGEQKPADKVKPKFKKEEDERMRNAAINACKYMVDNFENSTKQYEDAINWLKSLKDRAQPKQEWSEEDERMHQYVVNDFYTALEELKHFISKLQNALKSK